MVNLHGFVKLSSLLYKSNSPPKFLNTLYEKDLLHNETLNNILVNDVFEESPFLKGFGNEHLLNQLGFEKEYDSIWIEKDDEI
jgi:hypothetical protein